MRSATCLLLTLCMAFALNQTSSFSQNSEESETPVADGGFTEARQRDEDNLATEATTAPVPEPSESLAASTTHVSSFNLLRPTQETGYTAISSREYFWQISNVSQNIELSSPPLSDRIPTSTSPSETASEQEEKFPQNTTHGDVNAVSIMEELRSSGAISSYEHLVTSCSGPAGERLCGCSASCTLVDNCCYDSDFLQATTDFAVEGSNRYSCYSDINQKWTLSSPSRLINQCPYNWTDDAVRDLCENPTGNDLKSYVPCYSPLTLLSYRNLYCLHCNGLSDGSLWEVTFQSAMAYIFSAADNFAKQNNSAGRPLRFRGKKFVVSPRMEFEPSHCSFAVDQCNVDFTTNILSNMCSAYYSPVMINRVTYRNVHCFQCATGMSIGDLNPRWIPRQVPNPMSVLLNMRFDQKACPASGCVPVLTRVRGYYQKFLVIVSITPIANISALDKADVINLNTGCGRLVVTFVNAKMKQYEHTVNLDNPKAYEFEHKKEVTIILLIQDDIAVEEIPAIDQRVLSLNFESDVDSLVHVSCCENAHVYDQQQNVQNPTQTDQDSRHDSNSVTVSTTISTAINSAQKLFQMPRVILLIIIIDLFWLCLMAGMGG